MDLNPNIVKGKWREFAGEIKKTWGQLTDDDLESAKGDLTKVAGLIQRKYGESQEAIRTKLNSFVSQIGEANKEVKQTRSEIPTHSPPDEKVW